MFYYKTHTRMEPSLSSFSVCVAESSQLYILFFTLTALMFEGVGVVEAFVIKARPQLRLVHLNLIY